MGFLFEESLSKLKLHMQLRYAISKIMEWKKLWREKIE